MHVAEQQVELQRTHPHGHEHSVWSIRAAVTE
jgi:hypothetical protein